MSYYFPIEQIEKSPAPASLLQLNNEQISTLTKLEAMLATTLANAECEYFNKLHLRQDGLSIGIHGIFEFDIYDVDLELNEQTLDENSVYSRQMKIFPLLEAFMGKLGLSPTQHQSIDMEALEKKFKLHAGILDDNDEEHRYFDVAFQPMIFNIPEDFSLADDQPDGIAQTIYHVSRGATQYRAIVDSQANTFQFFTVRDGEEVPCLAHYEYLIGSIKRIEDLTAIGLTAEVAEIFAEASFLVHDIEVKYTNTPATRDRLVFQSYEVTVLNPATNQTETLVISDINDTFHALQAPYLSLTKTDRLKKILRELDKVTVDAIIIGALVGYKFQNSKLKTKKVKQLCSRKGAKNISFNLEKNRCIPVDPSLNKMGYFNKNAKVNLKITATGLQVKVIEGDCKDEPSHQAGILARAFKKHAKLFKDKSNAEIRYLIRRILNDQYQYFDFDMV